MIIQHFEEQVLKMKDKPAVESVGETVDYQNLNANANRIARTIPDAFPVSQTITDDPEETFRIGLLIEHGIPQVTTLLGVLKARKIYVPLDTSYPSDRLRYMINDARISGVITDRKNESLARQLVSETAGMTVFIMEDLLDSGESSENIIWETPPVPGPACVYSLYLRFHRKSQRGYADLRQRLFLYPSLYRTTFDRIFRPHHLSCIFQP